MTNSPSIKIVVQTEFLRDQSDPTHNQYTFGYTITISNFGKQSARLLRRHWIITDANGNIQEVYGDGVIGEQPLIQPGRSFSYSSGAILPTPVGTMEGTYTLINDTGEYFDAPILPFRLALPELVH